MRITSSAVSLNVEDVAASSAFLVNHFGFREEMAAPGFASLARDDTGMNVIFLRRGLPTDWVFSKQEGPELRRRLAARTLAPAPSEFVGRD